MRFHTDFLNNRLEFILAFSVSIPLIVYICRFYSSNLSDKIVDWGAFGSYISGITGIFSIILLYKTYKEQCRSNSISQFEQRFYTQLRTIREILMTNNENIAKMYNSIEKHFSGDCSQSLNRSDILMACRYYYRNLFRQEHFQSEIEQIISYVLHSIKMTNEHEALSDKQKNDYIQDLLPVQNECFMILLLLYVISKNESSSFRLLLDYKCFDGILFKNKLLGKIIDSIKSSSSLKSTPIVDGIEYENYEEESIFQTIKRLKE